MTPQQERELVKKAYPGTNWAAKVDKMSDSQVFSILIRLRNAGKI